MTVAQKCPDCEMELYTLDDIEEITKRSDKTLRNEFQKIRQENKKLKTELEELKEQKGE